MSRPQPWHEEARRLKAAGVPYREIAERVDRSLTIVAKLFSPKYRKAQNANGIASKKRRAERDPAYRAQRAAYYRAWREQQKEQHA